MSLMPSPFAAVLRALDQVFASIGARWYLFGAQAALLYGSARLTADVDVTVELGLTPTSTLADALLSHGFELRASDADFVARTRVMPMLHRDSGIFVDVVLGGPGIEELFLDRAQHHDFEGTLVPVASPEDLIAMKLLAGRSKDIDDVRTILAANRRRHTVMGREVARNQVHIAILEGRGSKCARQAWIEGKDANSEPARGPSARPGREDESFRSSRARLGHQAGRDLHGSCS